MNMTETADSVVTPSPSLNSTHDSKAQSDQKAKLKKIAIPVAAVLAIVFLGHFFYGQWAFEETDDAHTSANSAVLSAKVGGIVTDILVHENQRVKAGDLIMKLDPRDNENRVAQTEAEMKSVHATLWDAQKNHSRMQSLFQSGVVTQQQADNAQATYLQWKSKEDSLKAQLSQAKLDLEYTEVRAPTDGRIGRRNVEKGVVVAPGQPVVAFVQSAEYWVVANYKETQLKQMHIGQAVEVEVDAIGGRTFEGKVESFAPGSGSTFAVIPPDNATGNFVKIVQRVPVRIALGSASIRGFEDMLVPGLSVVTKVRIH